MANPYYTYGAYGYGQVQAYQTASVATPAAAATPSAAAYSSSVQYYQQPQAQPQTNYTYYTIVTTQQQSGGSSTAPAVVTSGTYAGYQGTSSTFSGYEPGNASYSYSSGATSGASSTSGRGRGFTVGRGASNAGVSHVGGSNGNQERGGGRGGRGRGNVSRGRGFGRGRGGGGGGSGLQASGTGNAAANLSPIDAAVLSVAQNYMSGGNTAKSNTGGRKWPRPNKPAGPNPNAEMKYCEICKISCVGNQAFNDHLNGKNHKKKEEQSKRGAVLPPFVRGQKQLRCELCDVTCIGNDSYDAHVRGVKHQKVLTLHTRLGKPIPSSEPAVVTPTPKVGPTATPTAVTGGGKKAATPKITFVGGTQLKSTAQGLNEEKVASQHSDETDGEGSAADNDNAPIGEEYVEAVVSNTGHIVRYHCKLCICDFNDENARLLHLKGRRHRLTYKQKVDPSLIVEMDRKTTKIHHDQNAGKKSGAGGQGPKGPGPARSASAPAPRGPVVPLMAAGILAPAAHRRPETLNDRYVMAKHATIYPTDEELQAIQTLVMTCEKALKLVSDHLVESEPASNTTDDATEPSSNEANSALSTGGSRMLKGVMRVGVLAKGLIMREEPNVHLLILCASKPTHLLLNSIYSILPEKLAAVSDEAYETGVYPEEAAFVVAMTKEPRATCTITLTSPIMRQENLPEGADIQSNADPADMLDRQKCLDALAALRHAKWFQAKASPLSSCVIVIRILQDLCRRVPTWHAISQWAVELLVEKCLASGEPDLAPSLALRRVFEAIASGLLLPGGPGLLDPCEKDPIDAIGSLTNQEREDITTSAQQALRLIALHQIHKVLDMEPMAGTNNKQQPTTPVTASTTDAGAGSVKRPPPGGSPATEVKKIKTDG